MDGRLMVMVVWMGWVFRILPQLPVSLRSCLSACCTLFHLPCVSTNSKSLLFKYNLKMLHCCLLWPSVNNVLLLSSDGRKVKARLEWVGQGTLFPRQPVVLFTLMPFTLIFPFSLPANWRGGLWALVQWAEQKKTDKAWQYCRLATDLWLRWICQPWDIELLGFAWILLAICHIVPC